MRKRDIDNLSFVLSLSKDDFPRWYDTLEDDDKQYCMELLLCHKYDLIDKKIDKKNNFTLANEVLDKIRSKT
jgi:hypothetical protein